MKKGSLLITITVIVSLLAGCGNIDSEKKASGRNGNQSAGVSEVLETGMAEEELEESAQSGAEQETEEMQGKTAEQSADPVIFWDEDSLNEEPPAAEEKPAQLPEEAADKDVQKIEKESAGSTEGIDVDLTRLSSTMVYSEVFNMMYTPEEYIGKIVKMEGVFSTLHDESSGNDYFACVVQDATACCSQGIEFVLNDSYKYPEEYPEDGEMITVVGTFDTYQEGEYTYCTLREAVLEKV